MITKLSSRKVGADCREVDQSLKRRKYLVLRSFGTQSRPSASRRLSGWEPRGLRDREWSRALALYPITRCVSMGRGGNRPVVKSRCARFYAPVHARSHPRRQPACKHVRPVRVKRRCAKNVLPPSWERRPNVTVRRDDHTFHGTL